MRRRRRRLIWRLGGSTRSAAGRSRVRPTSAMLREGAKRAFAAYGRLCRSEDRDLAHSLRGQRDRRAPAKSARGCAPAGGDQHRRQRSVEGHRRDPEPRLPAMGHRRDRGRQAGHRRRAAAGAARLRAHLFGGDRPCARRAPISTASASSCAARAGAAIGRRAPAMRRRRGSRASCSRAGRCTTISSAPGSRRRSRPRNSCSTMCRRGCTCSAQRTVEEAFDVHAAACRSGPA